MVTVKTLKDWGDKAAAPMAWFRVSLRLAPEFRKRDVFNFLLDDAEIGDEMLMLADKLFSELYGVNLPKDFYHNTLTESKNEQV